MRLFQLVLYLILFPALVQAQLRQFEIFGTITGDYSNKIYLFYDFNVEHKDSISAEIKDGKFYFKESAQLPVLVKFFLGGSSSTVQSVYVDNSKTHITCTSAYRFFKNVNNQSDTSNNISVVKVEGSATDNLKSSFEKWSRALNASAKTIQDKRDAYYQKLFALIRKHPGSKVGPYLLGMASNLSYLQINQLKELIDTSLKRTFEMIRVNHLVEIKSRLMKGAEGGNLQVTVFKGLNNKDVDIRKTKNKLSLVSCWSSACASCRTNNSQLKTLSDKYRKKGFGVISISFDNDRTAWRDAVRKLKSGWLQVIDTSGVDGQFAKIYGVEMVPENFLVDGKGKIIATGLSVSSLEAQLKRLL